MGATKTPTRLAVALPRWRRTLGLMAAFTCVSATAGSVLLGTGTFTPPVSDLRPLGLESWVLPGIWLAASVALPGAVTALLAWKRSRWLGSAAIGAGVLLGIELAVQIPFVGLDPLQGVMGTVAVALASLGFASRRGNVAQVEVRSARA